MDNVYGSILEESERVCKKQRICAAQSTEAVGRILQGLQQVSREASGSGEGLQLLLEAFKKSLVQQDLPAKFAAAVKDLHMSVSKLGKALDKAFIQDITIAYRDMPMDKDVLNRVIAEHFFHEGNFKVGDCFLREAHVADGDTIRQPFMAMHSILEQIRLRNPDPALHWVEENRVNLKLSSGKAAASLFEYKLHQLCFLEALEKKGRMAALCYAQQHFGPLGSSNLDSIQRLMGRLCFDSRSPPPRGPYSDLISARLWDEVARDFTRHCCGLHGQASESPLVVATAAGSVALPSLLKLASLLKDHSHELVSGEQLPVEIDLSQEFVFRSVFSCPVSREQSSSANPPWLLPCGHVLCKDSVMKIAKSMTRPFKCPYCPLEATPLTCQELRFPAVL